MTQLALDLDAVATARPERGPARGGLERLGETVEFGSLLLGLLELRGWTVRRTRAFAGEGVLVIARRSPFEVRKQGATLGEVAAAVFEEASGLHGASA